MKHLILITTIPLFFSCNSNHPESVHKSNNTRDICSKHQFSSPKEQADSLMAYYKKHDHQRFFCAFPNSFKEMEQVFGYDHSLGAAPLYTDGNELIVFFSELNSIDRETYYNKYIDICINGNWQADNIREAFGFADLIKRDPKNACLYLSKRKDSEVQSIFRFIFDGPHPDNEENKVCYKELAEILTQYDHRLSSILKIAYKDVMIRAESHGH